MEIKECKNEDFILKVIKQTMIDIAEKVKSNYKNRLDVYRFLYDAYELAEAKTYEVKIFGITLEKTTIHTDNKLIVSYEDRILKVHIIDPVICSIVRDEFTKLAETYENNIKTLCFEQDF